MTPGDVPIDGERGLDGWLSGRLAALDEQQQRRDRVVTQTHADGTCTRDGQRLLNFASNDYLNLSHDPRVCRALVEVAVEGVGAGGSPMICGRSQWHERLETALAEFEGTEAALLFPTGYAANVGTLTALMNPDDVVLCDRLNHASLIDGCRLSGAHFEVYRHDRLNRLADRLAKSNQRSFIVTDGVFSMDGGMAPLSELCEVAEQFGSTLIVDEAHGTGVLGSLGRGAAEACQVEAGVPVRIGTLSKAVGVVGGFVAGSSVLIDWLHHSARSQFFSTALPPAVCAAALESLRIIREEPQRREALRRISQQFRQRLRDAGLTVGGHAGVPIVPVMTGTEEAALQAAGRLRDAGFLVACVRPPTVRAGASRLRISVSSAHSEENVDRLAAAVIQTVRPLAEAGS